MISLTPMREGAQARHVALPRDAEADGSAVVHVLGAAEPLGGALRGGATQRVPWQEPAVPAKAHWRQGNRKQPFFMRKRPLSTHNTPSCHPEQSEGSV